MAESLGSYWPWYTAPSQPGSIASVFNQAMWPYTQFARNRVSQTPIAWHRIFVRFNHVRPTGGSRRTSRQRKRCWLRRIRHISCVRLSDSARFTDSWFRATCMLRCCGSLQRSRLPLTKQQTTTNQLQLKRC